MTQGEERIPCFAREESYTDEDMAIRRSISPSATSGRSMSNSKESSSVPQAASSGHYGSSTSENDENSCDVRSVVSVASFRKKFGKSQSVKDTRAEFDSVIEKMAQEQLQCRGTSTVVSASGSVKQCGNSKIKDDILAFLDGMDEQQRAFYTEDEEGKRKNKKDLDELKKGSFKQGVSDPTQDLGIQADPSLHDAQLLSESKDGRIRKLTPNVSKESSKIIPGKPDKDENTDIVSTTSNQDQIDPDEVSSAPAKVGNKEVLLMKPSNQEEEDRASPRICSAAIREGKKTLKDMNTLEEKERTLEERFKILEGRSKSSVVGLKPCGSKNRGLSASCGPLAEQLMKIDLSVRGGTLKISDRPLSESGCAALLNAIKGNDKLTELDLTGCSIHKGDELAQLVRNAPSLKRLSLEWNCLGLARTGIAALSSAIASSRSLEEVDLRSNRIGPSTAAALAHALRANNTLTCLDLAWNDIGACGATALLGMLEKNHTLTELRLAGNCIPTPLQDQIDKLLEENRAQKSTTDVSESVSVTEAADPSPIRIRASASRDGKQAGAGQVSQFQSEIEKLRQDLAALRAEKQELQVQKTTVDTRLETRDWDDAVDMKTWRNQRKEETLHWQQVEKHSEETKMEILQLKQELAGLQGKMRTGEHEVTRRMTALSAEVMDRKENERIAQEKEAEATRESRHLKDQMARVREDSELRIKAAEGRARSESEYNACLISKLEAMTVQRQEKHAQEVEEIRSKLTAEINHLKSTKESIMKEVEGHKSVVELFDRKMSNQEQVHLQEKEAAQQDMKNQMGVLKTEIESLQSQLDDKDMDLKKAKQKFEASVKDLENEIAKERGLVKGAELAKTNTERKLISMAAEMEQLKEKIKAEGEIVRLKEEEMEARQLKHSAAMMVLTAKHLEDIQRVEHELQASRKQTDGFKKQIIEMQAEYERKVTDIEKQLRAAETAVVEWIQQQFSALQSSLSFHLSVPNINLEIVQSTRNPSTTPEQLVKANDEPAQSSPPKTALPLSVPAPVPVPVSLPVPAPLSFASLVKSDGEESVDTVDEDLVGSGKSGSCAA